MFIKQISIVLDNVPGAMSHVSEILGREGVNIRAISVADTSDISTVRFVVDDPARALNILKTNGFATKETDVLAVETPDHPGGLNAVLKPLKNAGINVHYLYPHLGRIGGQAIVILGVDKPEEAQKALQQNWVRTMGKEVYSI
ncbi:ACT domain-containing protein [Syntrophorhabdus aromaticivorans]|uniref:ACT domain-containing protein n=1 Tax=Syntrophorhabdus aromaticivorans TaxID=328301 RepID=UPI000407F434|nr:ACT domain-containing protein [Syntrophorhabdus aromaticivorans]